MVVSYHLRVCDVTAIGGFLQLPAKLGIAAIWSQKYPGYAFLVFVGHRRHPAGGLLRGRRRKTSGPFFSEHAGRSENFVSHSQS
jgi:hypothetical protein